MTDDAVRYVLAAMVRSSIESSDLAPRSRGCRGLLGVRRHDRDGSRVSSRLSNSLVPFGRVGHRDAIEETWGRGAARRWMKRSPLASRLWASPAGFHSVKGKDGLGSARGSRPCRDRRVRMGANAAVLVLAGRVMAVEGASVRRQPARRSAGKSCAPCSSRPVPGRPRWRTGPGSRHGRGAPPRQALQSGPGHQDRSSARQPP
jgi:hypothetical protein